MRRRLCPHRKHCVSRHGPCEPNTAQQAKQTNVFVSATDMNILATAKCWEWTGFGVPWCLLSNVDLVLETRAKSPQSPTNAHSTVLHRLASPPPPPPETAMFRPHEAWMRVTTGNPRHSGNSLPKTMGFPRRLWDTCACVVDATPRLHRQREQHWSAKPIAVRPGATIPRGDMFSGFWALVSGGCWARPLDTVLQRLRFVPVDVTPQRPHGPLDPPLDNALLESDTIAGLSDGCCHSDVSGRQELRELCICGAASQQERDTSLSGSCTRCLDAAGTGRGGPGADPPPDAGFGVEDSQGWSWRQPSSAPTKPEELHRGGYSKGLPQVNTSQPE